MEMFGRDIYEQILVRSNVLDVIRFKSVCKSWYTLISDSRFIKIHLNHHTLTYNNQRRILMTLWSPVSNCLWSPVSNCLLNFGPWFFNFSRTCKLLGSCNGLVCVFNFSSQLLVANPSTRQVIKLPTPKVSHILKSSCWGFGYDSCLDDYKVILGYEKDNNHTCFQMLTLKSNVWKFVGQFDYMVLSHVGILCNDALHWFMNDEKNRNSVILSFHLSQEEFKEIPPPDNITFQSSPYDYYEPNISLGIMDGCLCIILHDLITEDLWIMKNYNVKQSWGVVGDDCEIKYEAIHILKELKKGIPYERSLCHDVVLYKTREFVGAPLFVESLVSPHVYNHNHRKQKRKRSAKLINGDHLVRGPGAIVIEAMKRR